MAAASLVIGAGCAHAPKTQHQAQAIESEAEATLNTMVARDPSLQNVLADAAGYVVFPEVGKGGAIVGGARGIGVVYENGQPIGYAELTQASIGLQLGGQTFSELIVFDNEQALARLKSGDLDVTANASAVALSSGAGAQADFQGGSEVFYLSRGGLMAGLDVAGQKINFKPEPPPHQ
ncbi:MAG: lipid-binding SYLF domain-containing protein [Polyangiaceae bacterium]|nr:lipid-binding SYLF domain-containing protein [Polyangiaceae bacterium]